MQERHLNEYRKPDNKKWQWKSIQGYGVYQILDCLNCFLVFFSSVISPLLSRSWFNQNQTTCQSISAWLPANTLRNIGGSLCHYLHSLSLYFWTVLKRFILLEHTFWIEVSVSKQLPHILMSRYECNFWNWRSYLIEPRHCFPLKSEQKPETVFSRSGCLSSAIGLVLTCCSWQNLAEILGRCDGEGLPKHAISLEIFLDTSLLLKNIKMNIKKTPAV